MERRETNRIPGEFVHYEQLLYTEGAENFFRDLLKNKPLIDLGCGPAPESESGKMESFAQKMGASEYIGVDAFSVDEDKKFVRTGGKGKFPAEYLKRDMLEYAQSSPENFGNVVMNGIDESIITSNEYAKNLMAEIARVVPEGGVAMGFNSPFLSLLEKYGFCEVKVPVEDSWLKIWQKTEVKT